MPENMQNTFPSIVDARNILGEFVLFVEQDRLGRNI